jgi:single-strand DNA-binding protein
MNLNKVILIGRLTKDSEVRTTQSGQKVASVGLATNQYFTDKSGQKQEKTDFHNLVFWGKQAELVGQYCGKGNLIMVEGRLQTRSWEGKDNKKNYTTEIIVENMQFGPRSKAGENNPNDGMPAEKEGKKEEMPVIDLEEEEIKPEDLPF